jgi:hypothetical protein
MTRDQVPRVLRSLCAHLVDRGKIELGTEQSRLDEEAARVIGAWSSEGERFEDENLH